MAVLALHTAATGLSALETNIDIIANNLANVNTRGFKVSRGTFEDLVYQKRKQPGVENSNGDKRPAGLYVGLGTQLSNTQLDFTQGAPIPSNGKYDMMIDGDGLFPVQTPQDVGGGVGYTRVGNFLVNTDGDLVLGNSEGPRLIWDGQADPDATDIVVSPDGMVSGLLPGETEPTTFGSISLSSFVNQSGLESIGGNLYIETVSSGPPITGTPTEGRFGRILQHFIEGSNAEPVTELVELIKTQRAFEMNSQVIQAADESLQVVSNLRRF